MNELIPNDTAPANGWWTREHILVVVLSAATVLAFYICYLLAKPFLPALAWALALAVVTHPLHDWLDARITSANLSAAIAVALVAITIVAPSIFVIQNVVRELASGIEVVRSELERGHWRTSLERQPRLARWVGWIEKQIDLGNATNQATTASTLSASSFVKGSAWGAMQLLITFFLLFYFFRDRKVVVGALRSGVPLSNTEIDEVVRRVVDTIHATIYGTLAVGAVQGLLGGLMFWWMGLPAPVLWGVIMSLLAIVPVLGAFVIWVPAALWLALQGQWLQALILTGWGLVVIGLIDNVLYPIFVGKRLQLHTVPVFIAILGGLFVFGTSGLILGPVALAVMVALVDIWRRRTAGGRTADMPVKRSQPTEATLDGSPRQV